MILKLGSYGKDVEKLQKYLRIKVDGIFGQETFEAVVNWQQSNKSIKNGIVKDRIWEKMFGSISSDKNTKPSASSNINLEIMFKIEKLKGHILDSVISQIQKTADENSINTVLRLSHFLAQCAHESGGFKATTENLNYSSDGLKKTFPKYFTGTLNLSYAKNPEKIANRVYALRMGNGDEASGDGYKFRGRGFIQLTGKSNYIEFDKTVAEDIIANPDLVSSKYPLMSAAFFFTKNKLWLLCDKGSTDEIVKQLTKRINGGYNGLEDRLKKFKEYYTLLK